jgi:hypothetical protein
MNALDVSVFSKTKCLPLILDNSLARNIHSETTSLVTRTFTTVVCFDTLDRYFNSSTYVFSRETPL